MKAVQDLLERLRPLFGEGGKLATFRPLFDAADAILFTPAHQAPGAPHVRDPLDIKRFMSMVILGLLPCVAVAVYLYGLRVLALIAVSYTVGAIVEVGTALIRKEEINEGFLVTGLVFPLILPPAVPFWVAGAGIAFGVFFGKEIFGGTGRNLFNPALVGRCFLALGYPIAMTSGWVIPKAGGTGRLLEWIGPTTVDALTSATPLVTAKQGTVVGLSDLFMGTVGGCVGETSVAAIILGGLIVLASRVGNWRTVAGILLAAAGLETALHLAHPDTFLPALWHLGAGGLMFGAFFMATDPVTSPVTNAGKWVYGILIGTVTILIRNFSGYVEGMMFAILLGNIAAPLIDEIVHVFLLRRLLYEA